MFFLTCLYVAIYFIRPFEVFSGLRSVPLLQIIGGIGIIGLLINVLGLKKFKLFKNGTDQLITGFFAAILFSYIAQAYLTRTITSFFLFLPSFIGYFLIAYSVKTIRQVNILYWVIIGTLIIMVIEGINQAIYHSSFIDIAPITRLVYAESGETFQEIRIRWVGIFSDPNDLAMAIVIPIPFLISKIFQKKLFLSVPIIIFLMYGLFLTKSRGGFLAVLVTVFVYLIIKYRSIRGLAIATIFALIITLYAPTRMGEISSGEESAYGRLEAWYAGFQMFKSSPIFGVGMGNFNEIYFLTAHNSFVLVLSEVGLLGAFFFTGLFLIPLRGCWELVFKENKEGFVDTETWEVYYASISSLVGIICSMAFLSRAYILLPYIFIGVCSSLFSTIKNQRADKMFDESIRGNFFRIISLTIMLITIINIIIKIALD